MSETRNINLNSEFVVKFGYCKTDKTDEQLAELLRELPKAIEDALHEKITDGEITAAPVLSGKWEAGSNYSDYGMRYYKCSQCGHGTVFLDRFCPSCGARMSAADLSSVVL